MAKRDKGTTRTARGTTTSNALGAKKPSKEKPAAAPVLGGTQGRSGGVVDAPGKRHRGPMPTDPDANLADSQAAKMRTAKTMVKTSRFRGRG